MQILTTALKYTGDGPRHLVRYKVDLCFCGRFFLVSTTATELFFFLFLTPIQHLFFIYIERAMKTTLASYYFIYFFLLQSSNRCQCRTDFDVWNGLLGNVCFLSFCFPSLFFRYGKVMCDLDVGNGLSKTKKVIHA